MRLFLTPLLIFNFVAIALSVERDDYFTIVALFNQKNSDAELAFKYAVQWHNIYSSDGTLYKGQTREVSRKNIFETSKIVCNLTGTEPGVIAIFGPEALRTAAITQSICKKIEIPHIQTTWQPSTGYPPLISLNFYPAADLLAQGFATIVRHMNWKTYAIVYQHDEALIRLQGILKIPDVSDNPVTVKQLEHGSDYRPLFKSLKDAGVQKIILDCETNDIINILQQAKDVELLNFPMSYLLTSLDAHTLDYSSLNTTVNLTLIRLFDPANENLTRNLQSWEVGEMRRSRMITVTPETVRTDAVLMIDAVNLFIEAVNHLHKTGPVEPRSMNCEDTDTWEGGYRIAAYMKEHKLAHPITGTIGFDDFGRRVNFTLQVLEYQINRVKATWSPENGTQLNITISASERKQMLLESLKRQKIIVASKPVDPYLMIRNKSHSAEDSSSPYYGYAVDLIEKISQELGFTYEFRLNEAPISLNEATQTWTGVLQDVISGDAQLGICDLTVTHQRRQYVDFSNNFMSLGISILYKQPELQDKDMFTFMDPLSSDVWLYTATAYLGISVLLYLIARMAPGDWENPHPCDENPEELENIWNLGNCMWLTMGSIMTQGCDILPKGISSRMAVSMWWFFSLLMTSSYTANLAAFLSKERMGPELRNIDDLLNLNRIKYGTLINGSTYQFFKTAKYSKYAAVWSKMSSFKPSTFVDKNKDGVRRVLNKNQDYAFFMESSSLEYELNKHCELKQIGGLLDSKGYAIAMPFDAPYRDEIDDIILQLQESGYLQTLKDKWWREENKGDGVCDGGPGAAEDLGALKLSSVGGVFLVLGIGVAVSFLISVVEFLWNVRTVSAEEHVTYWEAFKVEFKFAINFFVTKKAAKIEARASRSLSRELSESHSIADRVMQGATSFLNLDNAFEKMSMHRRDT